MQDEAVSTRRRKEGTMQDEVVATRRRKEGTMHWRGVKIEETIFSLKVRGAMTCRLKERFPH